MAILRFVTHPQVRISADIPVPLWGLSDHGRARAERFASQPWIAGTSRVISSAETKALETAAILAVSLGTPIEVRPLLHENDRSSTGFVPPDRFEILADAFFASPEVSIEGWETSSAAQQRIVDATLDLFELFDAHDHKPGDHNPGDHNPGDHDPGDIAVVAHGAVGTLLLCHLLNVPIARSYDQIGGDAAPGGGNFWSFDLAQREVLHRWRPFDQT